MHAREEGGPTESRVKGKERRNNKGKRRVASSRARDARGGRGPAGTRRAQHDNKTHERGAPEGQTKGSSTTQRGTTAQRAP